MKRLAAPLWTPRFSGDAHSGSLVRRRLPTSATRHDPRSHHARDRPPCERGPARMGDAEALPCRCCVVRPDERAEAKTRAGLFRGSCAAQQRSRIFSRFRTRAAGREARVRDPCDAGAPPRYLPDTLGARERSVVRATPREPGELWPRSTRTKATVPTSAPRRAALSR